MKNQGAQTVGPHGAPGIETQEPQEPVSLPGDASLPILFEQNPYAMYVYAVDTLQILEVNQAAVAQYGYVREEFLRLKLLDIRPADEVPRLLDRLRQPPKGLTQEGVWKHRRKNGAVFDAEVKTQDLQFAGRSAVLAVAHDVSERHRAHEVLQAAEAKYRMLVEQLPAITYVADYGEAGKWHYVSPQIEAVLAFSAEEWMANPRLWFQQAYPQDRGLLLEGENLSIATGEPFDYEYRMFTRDRRVRWIRDRGRVVRREPGAVPVMQGVMIDITASKQAEEALQEAEAKYRALVEQLPAITYIAEFGPTGVWRYVSPQITSLLGFSPEEWVANPRLWLERVHSDDREHALAAGARSRATGKTYDDQYRMVAKEGRVLWFRDRGTVVKDEAGGAPCLHGVMTDITASKQAEEALREAEERYRSIFENAVEGLFQATPQGRFLSVNPAAARMLGYGSPDELTAAVQDIGRELYVNPGQREEFRRLVEGQGFVRGFEYQVRCKDGSTIWLAENARLVRDGGGQVLCYEGTIEDVTERRRREAERQATFDIMRGLNSLNHLEDLFKLIHGALSKVVHADNCFVALYDAATDMFEYPFYADQFDSAPPSQKVDRSCTAYVFKTGQAMLIKQKTFDEMVARGEVELVGTPSPVWAGVPLQTPSGVIGVLVLQDYRDENAFDARDLEFLVSVGAQVALAVERKKDEAALRASEARLRLLIEQLPAVLFTTDKELRFTSSLGAGLARLGMKPNQMVGQTLFEYLKTEDEDFPPIAAVRRAIAGEPVTYELEWQGGSYACHAEPLRTSRGEIVGSIAMALDVTERKQLEAQLRQSLKMEAVGRLAGGIAHDFNNLLMVMHGYAELLVDGLPENELKDRARRILETTVRASGLTRQLLAFSRKQVLMPEIIDLRSVVQDMQSMLQRLIGGNVEMDTRTEAGLWPVKADRSQVEQVIVNLVVNARDVMPRGGKIVVETANAHLDAGQALHRALAPSGDYVLLAVTDNGWGMSAETQARVFEPFFTTKEKGKGTGLGLATVYGIVTQSGGYIQVYSEPSRGTTFKVYLPRSEGESASARPTPATGPARQGSETILLVEYEESVRDLAKEYLTRTGYTVLDAATSDQALEIARRHGPPIHLLLTDLTIPGRGGCELAEKIMGARPGIRVVYMSSYAGEDSQHRETPKRGAVLLQKPFTLHELATTIRTVLDQAPAET